MEIVYIGWVLNVLVFFYSMIEELRRGWSADFKTMSLVSLLVVVPFVAFIVFCLEMFERARRRRWF